MEMEQVNALCEELVKAVMVIMDPSSTQRYRLEALKVAGLLAPWACPETPNPGFPRGLSKLSSSPASAALGPLTPLWGRWLLVAALTSSHWGLLLLARLSLHRTQRVPNCCTFPSHFSVSIPHFFSL